MKVTKILVALDGSSEAERALSKAVELALESDAQLVLVRAVDPAPLAEDGGRGARLAAINEAAEYLARIAARLRTHVVRPIVRSVWYAGAAHAITEVARTVRADVILMTSRRRTDTGALAPGPIADVVRHRTQRRVVLVDASAAVETAGAHRRIVVTDEDMARLRALVGRGRNGSRRDQDHLDDLHRELDPGKRAIYTIVFPSEADIEKGRISVLAPIGTALIGYGAGDVVEWATPGGRRRLQIESVLFQPEAAGASGEQRPRERFAA